MYLFRQSSSIEIILLGEMVPTLKLEYLQRHRALIQNSFSLLTMFRTTANFRGIKKPFYVELYVLKVPF